MKNADKIMNGYKKTALEAMTNRLISRSIEEGHGQRWIDNRMAKKVGSLDAIENAQTIAGVNISVEWKRSATWGSNPTAEARIDFADGTCERFTGTASGCDYDKESAAVADALNQCPAIQKALIIASKGGKVDREGGSPYGATVSEYGANFSGGVGVSAFRNIFEYMGYTWECVASGKTFDAYTIRKA